MSGRVYLVGSGPGAPGLITFRAREVIDSADVILYDQLPGDLILATLRQVLRRSTVGNLEEPIP